MFDIDCQGTRQVVETMPRRHRDGLHPAALDGGAEHAARAPRRGPARRRSSGGSRTRARRSSAGSEYDYVLVNDDLDRRLRNALRAILAAERLQRAGAAASALRRFRGSRAAELSGLRASTRSRSTSTAQRAIARQPFARATKPATGSVLGPRRRGRGRPRRAAAPASGASDLRLWRSILRRWPKAARGDGLEGRRRGRAGGPAAASARRRSTSPSAAA